MAAGTSPASPVGKAQMRSRVRCVCAATASCAPASWKRSAIASACSSRISPSCASRRPPGRRSSSRGADLALQPGDLIGLRRPRQRKLAGRLGERPLVRDGTERERQPIKECRTHDPRAQHRPQRRSLDPSARVRCLSDRSRRHRRGGEHRHGDRLPAHRHRRGHLEQRADDRAITVHVEARTAPAVGVSQALGHDGLGQLPPQRLLARPSEGALGLGLQAEIRPRSSMDTNAPCAVSRIRRVWLSLASSASSACTRGVTSRAEA